MQLVRVFPHDGKRHSTTTQHVRSWLMSATNTVCVTNIVYLTLRTWTWQSNEDVPLRVIGVVAVVGQLNSRCMTTAVDRAPLATLSWEALQHKLRGKLGHGLHHVRLVLSGCEGGLQWARMGCLWLHRNIACTGTLFGDGRCG